jgi:hypothetical protein
MPPNTTERIAGSAQEGMHPITRGPFGDSRWQFAGACGFAAKAGLSYKWTEAHRDPEVTLPGW